MAVYTVTPGSGLLTIDQALRAAFLAGDMAPIVNVDTGKPTARLEYVDSDALVMIPHQFNGVTIQGVGKENTRAVLRIRHPQASGRLYPPFPHPKSPFTASSDKGAIVIEASNVVLRNLEIIGARSSSWNGAAIRVLDGQNLTVDNVFASDCDNGMLVHQLGGTVRLRHSRFENNGNPGNAGQQHNIYIGRVDMLDAEDIVSIASRGEGHLFKGRARNTLLTGSALMDLSGNGSYVCDIMGGKCTVIGCLLGEGLNSVNNALFNYYLQDDNIADPPTENVLTIQNTFFKALRAGAGVMIRIDPRLRIDGTPATYVMDGDQYKQGVVTGNISNNTFMYADAKKLSNTYGAELIHMAAQLPKPDGLIFGDNTLMPVDWARR